MSPASIDHIRKQLRALAEQSLRDDKNGTAHICAAAVQCIEDLLEQGRLLGHVIVAAGGRVVIPMQQVREWDLPVITREDRDADDEIRLSAILSR